MIPSSPCSRGFAGWCAGHRISPRRPAWLAGVFLTTALAARGQSDPHSPEAELASFRVLEGFEVRLFASEREGVRKPIQLRFGPDGRLWVAGSVTYPQVKPGVVPHDEVVVLADTDRDGRADRTQVFADGLHIPTGLELGDGGLYVGAATELLHLRDTDGDGRADVRRVIFRGFGTGDTHQTINSFAWGPSGELLFSQGLHAHSRIETAAGLEELRQAGVWRFWPRTRRLDPFWSGAMGAHNPFGNVFDAWGQPLVLAGNGHGIYHLTPAMIRTDHFLEQPSLWNQGRKFGGGDFAENSHWPAAHQGELYSGGYLQNTVERFRVTDAGGASFRVDRLPPLIESTNTAFRVVDARFGPDGALYLCDWYNPVIGHYQASFRHPDRDQARGRIWRVTAKGRPGVAWRSLASRPTRDVAEALVSPERWDRQQASRVLAERPAEEVRQALRGWMGAEASDRQVFEALGALATQGIVSPEDLSRAGAAARPELRAYAARVVGHLAGGLPDALARLERLVADPHPRVRLEAVVACSYVPDARAVEVAARVVDLPMEPPLEYAFTQAVHALEPHWRPALSEGRLTFDGRASRMAAFSKVEGGQGSARLAAGRLRRVGEVALDADTIGRLSSVVAGSGGTNELLALLPRRHFSVGTHYLAEVHQAALWQAIQSSSRRELRVGEAAAAGLKPLLEEDQPAFQAMAARLAGAWRVGSLRPMVDRLATNQPQGDPPRGSALRQHALMAVAAYHDDAARVLLQGMGRPGQPASVRADAIAALTALDLADAARLAALLLADAGTGGEAGRVVTALVRWQEGPGRLRMALDGVKIPEANARAGLAALGSSGRREPGLAALFSASVQAGSKPAPATLDDVPALVAAAKAAGQPDRGAELFRSPTLACASCHNVDGAPGKIGPDLGALGTAQTPDFILGAILEPGREVKEGFMAHEIVGRDGTTFQGYLRGETAEQVTLLDHLSGQTVTLARQAIREQNRLGSLMPPGLVDGLSREELRDLLAYLSGLGRKTR